MKTIINFISIFVIVLLTSVTLNAQVKKDLVGTKDYALISRASPVFHIIEYNEDENGSMDFPTGRETSDNITGKKYHWEYSSNKGAKLPTKSALFTHYISKVKAKGGSLVFEDINDNACTLKMPSATSKDKVIYLMINIFEDGANYTLSVIEK